MGFKWRYGGTGTGGVGVGDGKRCSAQLMFASLGVLGTKAGLVFCVIYQEIIVVYTLQSSIIP